MSVLAVAIAAKVAVTFGTVFTAMKFQLQTTEN
jgi:hypothetical protein